MILKSALTLSLLGAAALAPATAAMAAATPAAAAYSTAETDIGTLIDNPETKAILARHLPGFADNPQIEMARAMTLKQIQGFAGDQITDAKLAAIDADLAKIPSKK